MLKKILLALVVMAVVLVVIISNRPSEFRVTRSAMMSAPVPSVFAEVNDLHKWNGWSPWAKMDPNAKNSFEGSAAGAGAKMSWAGNMKVGAGSMTILESHPNDLIRIKLEFFKPFSGDATTEFDFQPQGRQTVVSWSMYGRSNFIHKLMSVFIDCDKMIGGTYEQGLATMKTIVETART